MSVYVHTSKTQREMGTMVNGCVWMLYIPGGKKDTNKRHKGGRKRAREAGSLVIASIGIGSQRYPFKADPPEEACEGRGDSGL